MKLRILTFVITELGAIGLSQTQVMPSEFSSILIQLPVVGLFIWYTLYSGKQNREWLNHLMDIQDKRHERTDALQDERHQRTDALFERILERIDVRQGQMADRVEQVTQQLAVNSSAINEAMRLAELAEELRKLVKQNV